jgi:pimeloyl-ACP methyl ester carboxylesterase
MRLFPPTSRLIGLALLVALVSVRSAKGQGKDSGDPIHFETADGVKIEGSYWPSKTNKKAPVAILLHDFNHKSGGSSKDDGWDSLAKALNEKDFAVLQFDFRGFGKSTTLRNPMMFWSQPNNARGIKGGVVNPTKLPESIEKSSFLPAYYPTLVNDVIAARAWLDKKNDAGELNTSNLVIIGAGEGATIGSFWLATECHRKRGEPPPGLVGPVLDARLIKWDKDYEGKDVQAAIWLGISPTLGGAPVRPLREWVKDASGPKTNKVPVAFIYGKDDKEGSEQALSYMRSLMPDYQRGKPPIKENPLPYTGEKAIDSKLSGSKLLQKNLPTDKWIANDYLGKDLKDKLREDWRSRDSEKSKQYWLFPPAGVAPAKDGDTLMLVPLNRFGILN